MIKINLKDLEKDFNSGLTLDELAHKYNTTKITIRNKLLTIDEEKYLVEIKKRKENKSIKEKELAERIVEEYETGKKIKTLAEKFGVHSNTISNLLKKYCNERYLDEKEKRREKRKNRFKKTTQERTLEAVMKREQAQAAGELSINKTSSTLSMFQYVSSAYEITKDGYKRKKTVKEMVIPYNLPERIVSRV